MNEPPRVTAIVPARDEAGAIADVVAALRTLAVDGRAVVDTIVVCDNGSRDATAARARAAGAQVVHEPEPGYGAACQAALARLPADCDTVLFVDGDGSVAIAEAPALLAALAAGADLAVGARRRVEPGALAPAQRAGTAFVCWLIRRLWPAHVTDLGPFRAIRRAALDRLGMADPRFGWTAEMQVRAIRAGLVVTEVAVSARRRVGRSKISGTVSGTLRAGRDLVGIVVWLRLERALSARPGGRPSARTWPRANTARDRGRVLAPRWRGQPSRSGRDGTCGSTRGRPSARPHAGQISASSRAMAAAPSTNHTTGSP